MISLYRQTQHQPFKAPPRTKGLRQTFSSLRRYACPPHPIQTVAGRTRRTVFAADPPGITQCIECLENTEIVKFARTRLMACRYRGDLHMADDRHHGLERR